VSRRSTLGALVTAVAVVLGPGAVALEPPPPPTFDLTVPESWPDPDPTRIDAVAYLLLDAVTGQVLVEHAADERRAVASTIKLLTALSVLERTRLDDEVVVGDEVLGIAGSGVGLAPGDRWSVEQLLDALIARSGNDAAEALAAHVGGDRAGFVAMMRADAGALGLEQAVIVDPSGLDDDNNLTARELATIARAALADDQLRPLLGRAQVLLPEAGRLDSRNLLLASYDGATGLKTGYTEQAGNSLVASARRGERELIAVVLGSGADPGRFTSAATLLDLGFGSFGLQELETELRFALGGGSVRLHVEPILVTLPIDRTAQVQLPVSVRPPEGDLDIEVWAGEDRLGSVRAVLDEAGRPAPVSGGAALGRGAADGAYAALRAAAASGSLR
jgi:serine-type D-Ala-D-Ala carboxypeptidase (penicillin-binding protein 5/6)